MQGLGFPLQEIDVFRDTIAIYVGESKRNARLLLIAASAPGPYQKALHQRGPGLHHLGHAVPSRDTFLASLPGSGWFTHPASVSALQKGGAVFLARPGVPLLLEVFEETPARPSVLAPVVERVRVRVDADRANRLSCLDIPELMWSTTEETALDINQQWMTGNCFPG